MNKIRTIKELESIKGKREGYVLITDKPNNTFRLHRANCPHVDVNNFSKKVIDNQEENGSYYWFLSKEEAFENLQPDECLVCRR